LISELTEDSATKLTEPEVLNEPRANVMFLAKNSKQRNTLVESDPLTERIKLALQEAEKQLLECGVKDNLTSNDWKKLEEQNVKLKESLKSLNELLVNLLIQKEGEMKKKKQRAVMARQKSLVRDLNSESNQKQLKVYEHEYIKISSRLKQISDPQYLITLKTKCNDLEKIARTIAVQNTKLELQQKGEFYKGRSDITGDDKITKECNEINNMASVINYTLEIINKADNRLIKCEELIKKEKEQLKKLNGTWEKTKELAQYYNIPIKRKKEKKKPLDKEYKRIQRELEKIEKDRQCFSKHKLIVKNDLDKQLKTIRNKLELAMKELNEKKKFVEEQEMLLNEMLPHAKYLLFVISRPKSREEFLKEQLVTEKREYYSAKKLQKHWKAYLLRKSKYKAINTIKEVSKETTIEVIDETSKASLKPELIKESKIQDNKPPKCLFNLKQIEDERNKIEQKKEPNQISKRTFNFNKIEEDRKAMIEIGSVSDVTEASKPTEQKQVEAEDELDALFKPKPKKVEEDDFLSYIQNQNKSKEPEKPKDNILDFLLGDDESFQSTKHKGSSIKKKQEVIKRDILEELDDL